MLVSGTLANRANAGFEPTPERYAQLIAYNLLAFAPGRLRSDEAYTVLEPCIGVGDLAAPVAAFSGVRLYAVEQDPQRAARSRQRFPAATLLVPPTTAQPVMRSAVLSEADILAAVHRAGIQHSPGWSAATTWQDKAHVPNPLMAYAGTSHIVGGFVTGFLDGRVLHSPDGMPFVFSSFQSKERVKIELDAEALEEEQAKGVTSVTVYETTNKPMVGALNLATGETTFAQGEEVYQLLAPWMATIAAEVIAQRPPVYDPAQVQPWQYRLAATIGADKQLPGTPHPGLAAPQFHMSCALYAGITQRGHAAVQGAPGTGKTRQTILTAAMLAYRWRHRPSNIQRRTGDDSTVTYELVDVQKTLPPDEVQAFVGMRQSRSLRRLRRAWKANPNMPGDAPRALPIIVTSPKRVVRSAWEQEIEGAFPRAEVVHIEGRSDLLRFFRRCAESAAPAVFGIIPQSLTRCFTTVVVPDVIASSPRRCRSAKIRTRRGRSKRSSGSSDRSAGVRMRCSLVTSAT